ncbi:hypothetical protein A3860_26735 [Niastella vici]|uniref:Uncharacterized protein n=1 Tax=Niastella vici TaxID=1703345 RepID=A0A1V9FX94_9BACT|nr:hypothetical protein [Niastella vici]OQP62908.1 hypothetical protein A3860_26735 [Niastella vici]
MSESQKSIEEKESEIEFDPAAVARILAYRDELNIVFHKNQESFEKQLTFIAAGALTLSIAFIKDIVKTFDHSSYKGLLGWGWGALVVTLLANLISHLVASNNANKAIKEINENDYEPQRIECRNRTIVKLNWTSVFIMIIGIALIVSFIIINTLL